MIAAYFIGIKKELFVAEARRFSSPWTLDSPYWLIVHCADKPCRDAVAPILQQAGAKPLHQDASLYGWKSDAGWATAWESLASVAQNMATANALRAAVIAGEHLPSHQEITLSLRPFAEIDAVAANLWLARALDAGRLICCMQKVIDRRSKLMGYEAFARIEQEGGNIVSGKLVMQASHALRIEYQVDRLMHRQAIQTFVEFDLEGFVFINFLTGFIHRPEVYLEGLSQAVEQYKLLARAVVLDVPLSDYAQNVAKIKTIAQYCRSRGFAIALDDVNVPEGLAVLVKEIHPAFIKLDSRLGQQMLDGRKQGAIKEIIRIAHDGGAAVLAEGVESEALYQAYLDAGADMFQGYYIGEPERFSPADKAKRQSGN